MGVVTCGCRCNQEVNVNDEEISKETEGWRRRSEDERWESGG